MKQLQPYVPTVVIPMDGYHYYRNELDQMEDPEEAHARRGSIWTFNASKLVNDLKTTKMNGYGMFPSFDHMVGDPKENDIEVKTSHRIIIIEGNYLLCDDLYWRDIICVCWIYLSIFINCDEEVYIPRLVRRHMISWSISEEKAKARVDYNDKINADYIAQFSGRADLVIKY